jgi:hypothetical protein
VGTAADPLAIDVGSLVSAVRVGSRTCSSERCSPARQVGPWPRQPLVPAIEAEAASAVVCGGARASTPILVSHWCGQCRRDLVSRRGLLPATTRRNQYHKLQIEKTPMCWPRGLHPWLITQATGSGYVR